MRKNIKKIYHIFLLLSGFYLLFRNLCVVLEMRGFDIYFNYPSFHYDIAILLILLMFIALCLSFFLNRKFWGRVGQFFTYILYLVPIPNTGDYRAITLFWFTFLCGMIFLLVSAEKFKLIALYFFLNVIILWAILATNSADLSGIIKNFPLQLSNIGVALGEEPPDPGRDADRGSGEFYIKRGIARMVECNDKKFFAIDLKKYARFCAYITFKPNEEERARARINEIVSELQKRISKTKERYKDRYLVYFVEGNIIHKYDNQDEICVLIGSRE